jgi:hypothetical protein
MIDKELEAAYAGAGETSLPPLLCKYRGAMFKTSYKTKREMTAAKMQH